MKRIVKTVLVSLLALLFAVGAFACKDANDPYVAHTMTVGEDGTFRILQLTDIHLIDSDYEGKRNSNKEAEVESDLTLRDEWAMTAVRTLIEDTQPDLIMVTGDSVYNLLEIPREISNDNYATFQKFANFIDSFDIPWAFCFGNHDEEGTLHNILGDKTSTKLMLGEYLQDETENCLYADGPEDINGVGNYIINVLNKDGSVNNAIVVFDSGSYYRKGYWNDYEYVHDDQLAWYEDAIKHIAEKNGTENVKSIVFQHIPTVDYKTVLDNFIAALAADGEDWRDVIKEDGTGTERTVEYDGETITYHGGVYNEGEVCHSYVGWYPPNSEDAVYLNGGHTEFETLVRVGSTQAVFCGHDHRNTYSFTYQGVRLTYGMSIDYSANGLTPAKADQDIYDDTTQRGGTLITLNADSSVTVEQVPFTRNLYREEVERRQRG